MSRSQAYQDRIVTKHLNLPLNETDIADLRIGERVLLTGVLFTARDSAHQRMLELIREAKDLPIDLTNSAIFYCGPSPARPGKICGAVGPTTSSRMDKASLILLDKGLKVMIGKGERSVEVTQKIKAQGAVYFTALGGVAALLSKCIVSCETFTWDDLGTEAIHRMAVRDFPVYVAIK